MPFDYDAFGIVAPYGLGVYTVHSKIRVYSTLAVLPIMHYSVCRYNTVHRIIRVYSTPSRVKAPYGATMAFGEQCKERSAAVHQHEPVSDSISILCKAH